MAIEAGTRQVGEFAPRGRRQIIRTPRNPMDKCTIVSIYPKQMNIVKRTVEPGVFTIPAGTYDKPGVCVVGTSAWWSDRHQDQPILQVPVGSVQCAEAIIKDEVSGMVAVSMPDAMPGLFFTLGDIKAIEVHIKFKTELEKAKARQDNWFNILIRQADSLWARSNGNRVVISEEMLIAARELGYTDNEWMKNDRPAKMVNCKFCGFLRNPQFPICGNCKIPDPEHPLTIQHNLAANAAQTNVPATK